MDIFRITAVGVTGALLAVIVRQYKSEYAAVVSIASGIVLLSMLLPYIKQVFDEFGSIVEGTGVDTSYFILVMKVTGIAYLSHFAAQLCRDAGEGAAAIKIEAAAKVAVMVLTLPVLRVFLNTVIGILG